MIHHLILVEWSTIFLQDIENPLKFFDILLKFESSLIMVEYIIYVRSSKLIPPFSF